MLTKPHEAVTMPEGRSSKKRRLSPLLIAGICVPVVLALIAGSVFLSSYISSNAAQDNVDCTLVVPANPLTAKGLATPYQLTATNAQQGACHEANTAQSAF